jgi:hypothetical protein
MCWESSLTNASIANPFRTDLLKEWIHQCESHQLCRQRISGTDLAQPADAALPSRCIEKVNGTYYLRETKGQRGPYLALSWRKVYSPLKPNIVTGWGSFEHPSFTDDDVSQTGDAIFAFRISILHGRQGNSTLNYMALV